MYGWTGRLLEIDLAAKKIRTTSIQNGVLESYVVGKGLGAFLLRQRLPQEVDPLSPENLFIICSGPLSGLVPTTGKFATATKSPLTGLFLDSDCRGFFAAYLKRAGFDALLIKGKARALERLGIEA